MRPGEVLQDGADTDAPVPHIGHLAQASVEEAVEGTAEAQPGTDLGFVTPAGELGAILARVGAEQVRLPDVRHGPKIARQLEDHEGFRRHLPGEVEDAIGDAAEAKADRGTDLQVVAEEHARAHAETEIVGKADLVAKRQAEGEIAGLGDTDHRASVHLARRAAQRDERVERAWRLGTLDPEAAAEADRDPPEPGRSVALVVRIAV